MPLLAFPRAPQFAKPLAYSVASGTLVNNARHKRDCERRGLCVRQSESPCRGSLNGHSALWIGEALGASLYFRHYRRHETGWYQTDDNQSGETYTGAAVVWGHKVYQAIVDSCTESICVLLDTGEPTACDEGDFAEQMRETLRYADREAELLAERARDDDRTYRDWQALVDAYDDQQERLSPYRTFADGSIVGDETALSLMILDSQFMSPYYDEALSADEALEYLSGDLTDDEATYALQELTAELLAALKRGERCYFARLSASGYLDCTEWLGPYPTLADAASALVDTYDAYDAYDAYDTDDREELLPPPPAQPCY